MNDSQKPTAVHISDRQRWMEISAVIATASGKFIFMDWLNLKLAFILCAIVGWSAYVFMQRKRVQGILHYWGFRTDNFLSVFKIVLPFAIGAFVACVIIGFYRGTLNITWHIFPIIVLYPLWGIVQQFLCIALVAGNLREMKRIRMSKFTILLVTAILFGALHFPFYSLVAGTFVLALFYGWVFLKQRNLFVLGIFHGWLGAIFFYAVVGRDPFEEVFGKLF